MSGQPQPPYRIETFDPARHDRTGFSCGVVAVDQFFKKTANKLALAGNVRLYVMTSADDALIGFYAINAHAFDYRDLPKPALPRSWFWWRPLGRCVGLDRIGS